MVDNEIRPDFINIVMPNLCGWDGTQMLLDADGSITGWGFPVWYCPVCWNSYPAEEV